MVAGPRTASVAHLPFAAVIGGTHTRLHTAARIAHPARHRSGADSRDATALGLQTSMETASYLFLFAAGAVLASNRTAVQAYIEPSSRAVKWALAMATAAALSGPSLIGPSH